MRGENRLIIIACAGLALLLSSCASKKGSDDGPPYMQQRLAYISAGFSQMGSAHKGGKPLTRVSGTPNPPSMGYGDEENPVPFGLGLRELAKKGARQPNW